MTAHREISAHTRPESKERLRLWLRLLKVSRAIEVELRERFRVEFATTLPRFDVMSALDRYPDGLKMSELSKDLKVSNGNVTVIVDRLLQDGFILREAVPGDRRAARIRLTREGQQEFSMQAAAHEAWVDALLDEVDADQAAELSVLLNRIAKPSAEDKSDGS